MNDMLELFSKKEVQRALEIAETSTDGSLLYSLMQSRTHAKNTSFISWKEARDMSLQQLNDVQDFGELDSAEKTRILKKGAQYLYSKKDIDRAFEIIEIIVDRNIIHAITQSGKEPGINNAMGTDKIGDQLYDIMFNKWGLKRYKKLIKKDPTLKNKIEKKLKSLTTNPRGCKEWNMNLGRFRSCQIQNNKQEYCVVYQIIEKTKIITIFCVIHRNEVYEIMGRYLRNRDKNK